MSCGEDPLQNRPRDRPSVEPPNIPPSPDDLINGVFRQHRH